MQLDMLFNMSAVLAKLVKAESRYRFYNKVYGANREGSTEDMVKYSLLQAKLRCKYHELMMYTDKGIYKRKV